MNCTICNLKKICKLYDLKTLYNGDIEFNITSCKFQSSNTNDARIVTMPSIDPSPFASSFDEEELQRLIAKQNGIKEEENIKMKTCSSCKCTDYERYMSICSVCRVEICGNCGTNDNGLNYCQKCWEEL